MSNNSSASNKAAAVDVAMVVQSGFRGTNNEHNHHQHNELTNNKLLATLGKSDSRAPKGYYLSAYLKVDPKQGKIL